MAILQSTTISGSNSDTGSLAITGSTMVFPIIEPSLTSSFSGSGKMWVNSDTQNLQYTVGTTIGTIQSPASFMGAWSAGGTMPTAIKSFGIAGANIDDQLAFGGCTAAGGKQTATYAYNGTSWATGGALGNATYVISGTGTQNAALAVGGRGPGDINSICGYDGSSWSLNGSMICTRHAAKAMGSSNAGFIFGGNGGGTYSETWTGASAYAGPNLLNDNTYGVGFGSPGSAVSYEANKTEIYEGVAWSQGNAGVNGYTAQNSAFAAGTSQNAGLVAGGDTSPATDSTMEYNGISWVNGCTMPDCRRDGGRGGNGGNDSYVAAGGSFTATGVITGTTYHYQKNDIPPYTTCVWTLGSSLITPRQQGSGAGDKDAALVAAGVTPSGRVTCTEEYSGIGWSAGGAIIIARSSNAGGGTQNAAWIAGGEPSNLTSTELYNGSTWASSGALNAGRYGLRGTGTQNAAQAAGQSPVAACNETFDGSTWSTATVMPAGRSGHAMAGTSAASILVGGSTPSYVTDALLWDGSAWSSTTAMICRRGIQSGGTQNDALAFAGYNPAKPSSINMATTELYNGTAWSAQGNLARAGTYGMGTSTPGGAVDSFYVGGTNPAYTATAQFYNATCSSTLCTSLPVWSGGAALITARYRLAGGGQSTQNSSIVFGGRTPTLVSCTEEYNGTAWSAQTGLILARSILAGAGSEPAALAFGGYTTGNPSRAETEEYNGTAWSGGGDLTTGRSKLSGNGTQNDALAAGGESPTTTATEEYNGTAWSNGGSLIAARYSLTAAGASTNAAIVFGGYVSPNVSAVTEEYNGSSWSTGGSLINVRNLAGGAGINNAALAFGGYGTNPASLPLNVTETYDGTSWSADVTMITARNAIAGTGTTQGDAMAMGGQSPTILATTELYNVENNTCIGAWSAGGNIIAGRRYICGSGTQNAGLASAGRPAAPSTGGLTCTEEYDGTTWSGGGCLSSARYSGAVAGTQSATFYAGGENSPSCANFCATEEYDGSTWSAGGNLITARRSLSGAGLTTAGLAIGGIPSSSNVEEYDGTTWTAGGALITGVYGLAATGTQNAAVKWGGNGSSQCTEEYDGSTWATSAILHIPQYNGSAAGTQNDALAFTGESSPITQVAFNQGYNGLAWSTCTSMPTKKTHAGSQGSGTAAFVAGGVISPSTSVLSGTDLYNCSASTRLGAGTKNWIGAVNFVTE